MKQKGEITLFVVLILAAFTGLVLLCALEIKRSFNLLEQRTRLFLCVKETKGELNLYLKFMGRTNWAIENLDRVKLITVFIPGLQGVSANAEKTKKALITLQNMSLPLYLKKLKELKQKHCPLDPQLLLTPFKVNGSGYARGPNDVAIIRKRTWSYYFLARPYLLELEIETQGYKKVVPVIKYRPLEKGGKSFSPSSFVY